MAYLKHERGKAKREPKPKTKVDEPVKVEVTGPPPALAHSMQHNINHVAGLDGVEASLDVIGDALHYLTRDNQSVNLSLGIRPDSDPIRLTLAANDYEDTMDRVLNALERIADSVAKLAGLNRPRLESWHEQEAYTPRFREVASDGGAPGAKTDGKG